jgi:tetratricopeptide (TPR) repeat protein
MNDPLTHEEGCWQHDLASQYGDVRAEARLQLGIHQAAQGRAEAAERAFAAVDPDDDRVAAARASLRLHRLLIATGQTTEAWDALATTNELSDARHAPDVELELAARDATLGQHEEAAQRYRAVLASRTHRDPLGALAAYRLGDLQSEQGARDRAAALWRLALHGADEGLRPHVLVRLADLLRGRPENREAEDLYQQAVASDHPDLAPRAALALASLLEQRDALSPALALYAIACASGHRDVAEIAELRRHALMRRRTREALDQAQRLPLPGDPSRIDHERVAGWHPWRKVKLDRILPHRKHEAKQPPSDSPAELQSIGLVFTKIGRSESTGLLRRMDALTAVADDAAINVDYVIYHSQFTTAQDDPRIPTMLLAVQIKGEHGDWPYPTACSLPLVKCDPVGTCMNPLCGDGQPRSPDALGAPSNLLLLRYAQAMAHFTDAIVDEHSLDLMSAVLADTVHSNPPGVHGQRCRTDPLYLLGGSHCCGNPTPNHPS